MKYTLLLVLAALAAPAFAQSGNLAVQLTWTASANSTASNPGNVQLYRAQGTCTANASNGSPSGTGWQEISANAPAGGPYLDTGVTPADTYCYYQTATVPGYSGPSAPSNLFQISVVLSSTPAAPTGLSGTVVTQ